MTEITRYNLIPLTRLTVWIIQKNQLVCMQFFFFFYRCVINAVSVRLSRITFNPADVTLRVKY